MADKKDRTAEYYAVTKGQPSSILSTLQALEPRLLWLSALMIPKNV